MPEFREVKVSNMVGKNENVFVCLSLW